MTEPIMVFQKLKKKKDQWHQAFPEKKEKIIESRRRIRNPLPQACLAWGQQVFRSWNGSIWETDSSFRVAASTRG